MDLLITFLYILFVLSAIVLVVVILLQEGKGGGLTSALGTSGQQTFGVGASGINKFTGWTGADTEYIHHEPVLGDRQHTVDAPWLDVELPPGLPVVVIDSLRSAVRSPSGPSTVG